MLWEIDIHPAAGEADRAAAARRGGRPRAGPGRQSCTSPRPAASGARRRRSIAPQVERLANELLADLVVEPPVFGRVGDRKLIEPPSDFRRRSRTRRTASRCCLKPGVMDPVAQSALAAAADLGVPLEAVATLRKYWFARRERRGRRKRRRPAAGQRRDRAGGDRSAARCEQLEVGPAVSFRAADACRSASWTMTRSCG